MVKTDIAPIPGGECRYGSAERGHVPMPPRRHHPEDPDHRPAPGAASRPSAGCEIPSCPGPARHRPPGRDARRGFYGHRDPVRRSHARNFHPQWSSGARHQPIFPRYFNAPGLFSCELFGTVSLPVIRTVGAKTGGLQSAQFIQLKSKYHNNLYRTTESTSLLQRIFPRIPIHWPHQEAFFDPHCHWS